jgi:hypothetical protein
MRLSPALRAHGLLRRTVRVTAPWFLLLAALPALSPAQSEAQYTPSILQLLPTEGRVLQVGSSAPGQFTEQEFRSTDGVPLQAWEVRGAPGDFVWIDLVSPEFDAFLYVLDTDRGELLADDDSAGACDSRIPVEIPSSGRVLAVAAQVGVMGSGSFTLHATLEPRPLTEGICAYASQFGDENVEPYQIPEGVPVAGQLASVPVNVTGTLLEEGSIPGPVGGPMVAWEVELRMGDILQFDVISTDFDPVMLLTGPGIDGFLEDDDSGGDLNSRIIFTPLVAGTYRIHVTSFGGGTGDYQIRVGFRP